jgi:hypothetical protein
MPLGTIIDPQPPKPPGARLTWRRIAALRMRRAVLPPSDM